MPADAQISTNETAPDAGPDAGPEALRRSGSPATNLATPTCLTCHYALTGVREPRCPECGRAFDPTDPSTFGPRKRSVTYLVAKSGPTWKGMAYLAIPLVLVLCIVAAPHGSFSDDSVMKILFTGAMLGCGMVLWCLAILTAQLALLVERRARPRLPISFFVLFAALIASFFIIIRGVNFKAKVLISLPALNAAADAKNANPQMLGLFRVQHAVFDAAGAHFQLAGTDTLFSDGTPWLVRTPPGTGEPRWHHGVAAVLHVTGDWWAIWDPT